MGHHGVHDYHTGLLPLASAYNAKTVCSCIFVMERDVEDCREWARVSPAVARFQIDWQRQAVVSRSLGGWSETAQYVDDQVGCKLVR